MKSTLYLYGVEPNTFKDMPYKKALEFKLLKVTQLFRQLYVMDSYEEDHRIRLHHVDKALNYTRNLLKELDGTE